MKPHQWLDLLDIGMRILAIIRQLLAEFWNGRGDGDLPVDQDSVYPRSEPVC